MKRYILRFRGAGSKPEGDLARICAVPGLKVVDESGGRMMLVEAPEDQLPELKRSLPQWAISEEAMIPLPDPRQKVQCG